jgi:hypothetical protein
MSKYNSAESLRGELIPRPARGFLVKVVLEKSEGRGLGVFADQFIPANTKIAEISGESKYFNEEEALAYLESLPSDEERVYWLIHVYGFKDKIALDPYDLLMFNHSFSPNMTMVVNDYNDAYLNALRDILKGEELTEDYNSYPDLPFLDQLLGQYGIVEDYCSANVVEKKTNATAIHATLELAPARAEDCATVAETTSSAAANIARARDSAPTSNY